MRCKACNKFMEKPIKRKVNGEYTEDWELCTKCNGARFDQYAYMRDHEYTLANARDGVTTVKHCPD